ncbi:CSC1-like protein ERD4 [Andrographis paniculata]|uniref:CSC1-like protein ERD4 n=1 Tax=Andrographis paniculata TaxID=175694 RepID=UPI0021E99934|nr:CSC1-like protein ERD4 [Andrographis paniculata]
MDFSSFVTSLATSFVIFLILMLLFTWLSRRPGNNVVYYPNRILRKLDPHEGSHSSRSPFAWIREALASTEADVIRASGVDSAVYFVFLTTVLGIFVLSGLVLLPVLLPVAATAHGSLQANATSKDSFNDLDRLSMAHIEQKSNRLWAFLAAVYWVSIITCYLLWKAYNHVSHLRAAALMSPEVKDEQFAVVVRDIPSTTDARSRKEQVDSYFKAIYPDTFYRSMVVTNNKEANKIHQELEGFKKKLAHAEAVYSESRTTSNPEGVKPTTKTGFLGLIGKKVDALDYYDEKIKELTVKLESEQARTLKDKQQSAAVIFFNNRVTAAAASQSLHDAIVDKWTVMAAPESREILWSNLAMNYYARLVRRYAIYFLVFLTIFFYMIPIAFISAVTTLRNLIKYLPFLKPVVKVAAIKTILEAYLPQLALIIFLALLPKFLLFLSKAEGIVSESHAQRAASGKYFYFNVLNVFIGITLGSALFDSFKEILNDPKSIPELLGRSLPRSATFFLTFVALKFFVSYGLELSRIVPLIIFHLKKKYLCKTVAEEIEAWAPGDLGYATRIPADMLIVMIVFCYSVIAPLIIPFGVVYFGLGWLVLRNQVLKVYVPSYETYGRMWPHIFVRVMASLVVFQLTMLGYFGTKEFSYTPILIPLPILSVIFAVFCTNKFYRFFKFTALDVACRELKEAPAMDGVFRSFIPPCLVSDKTTAAAVADEEQFDDALSQVSRAGSFVV